MAQNSFAPWTCGCRKPVPPGQMLRWSLAARPAPPARVRDDLRLVGLKLVFLIAARAVSLLGLSRREGVAEGRRDPHAAPSARRGPARAASGSSASGMAGPGVAGAARGHGASRTPGGDAIDRRSRHGRALAPGDRPPPLGATVAPGPVRAPGDAP